MTDDELDALRSELGRLSGSERIRRQIELAQALTASYRRARAGDPSAQPYLEEAIEVLAEAYDHLEPGELLRGTVAAQAGWLLGVRYVNHGRSENDLETGIRLLEEALTFPESPYLPRATVLLVIGGLLLSRVTGPSLRSASMRDDADQAADYFQQVLDGLATNPEITSMAQNLLETARELQGPTGEIGRGSPPAEYAFDGPPLIDRDLPVPPATTSEPTALAPTEFDGPSGRVVSTGLAHAAPPNRTVPATRAAAPDTDYLFWFAVGRIPARDAIDDRFVELDLPDGTPAGARITVALFGFPGEIAITPGAEVGELVLRGDGSVVVDRQPGTSHGDRLLFPIRTPGTPGRHRLRCNVYCRQTLLQSRLVEIDVDPDGRYRPGIGVRSTTDYLVDTTLDAAELAELGPLTLSVLLNDNGNGSHGFRFLGSDGTTPITADVQLGAEDLQDDILRARRALQKVSWDGGGDWDGAARFRYDGRPEPGLARDLIELARAGYRLWTTICGPVAREREATGETGSRLLALQRLMRSPGTVEFATKYSARLVVPAALFYDFDLDTGDPDGLTVCDVALAAIARGADLAAEPCFRGDCPNAGPLPDRVRTTAERRVVCPGGFWGFRHEIGLPQSVRAGTVTEPPSDPPTGAPGRIPVAGLPHVVVAVASEFGANPHPRSVAGRGDGGSLPVVDERGRLLDLLRSGSAPHLVYLFCHGLVSDTGLPALRVGANSSAPISPDSLADMFWATHPLVILNGCRTTAVEPRYAMNFVDVLIRDAAASGVVGTEVITHEALAASFADLLLDGWLRPEDGIGIGAAMRRARLGLLAQGNPLGMIYVAYAAPQLRLCPTP